MAEVGGKVVMRSKDGRLYQVAPEDVPTVARDQGWNVAGDGEVEKRLEERAQYARFGSTGQQALGAVETAVRTATLGAVPGLGSPEDIAGRSEVLAEESPIVDFAAQAAGAALPALATAGAGSVVAGAGRLAQAGILAAEGIAGGTAAEVEEARRQKRDVSVGNILLYGVGGEILGRAVPAALRAGAGAVRKRLASEAVEAGEGVLAGAERRALEASADVADGVPAGPDRDVFLSNASEQIIDTASTRAAQAADQLAADMAETTLSEGTRAAKVRKLVAKTNPEQRAWAADTSQGALDLRSEIAPRPTRKPKAPEVPEGAAPEPLPAGAAPAPDAPAAAPPPARSYADVPELKKPTRELDRALTEGSEALDQAAEGHEWFEAAGRLERNLAKQEEAIAKVAENTGDPLAEELRAKVADYRTRLRMDRERPDLWGQAADYQKGLSKAVDDHWRPASREVASQFGRELEDGSIRFDPAKLRAHFRADEVGRGVAPEFIEKQLQGAEQAIALHRQWGTASKEQLSRMQKSVDSLREQVKLSDDVRGAKARATEREGVARESARFEREQAGALREERAAASAKAAAQSEKSGALSDLLGMAVGAAADSFGIGMAVSAGTKLLRMSRLLGTLGRTGDAAVASAARGAVMGNAGRALRHVERAAGAAPGVTVPLATTAIARFQGDYPSVQSAFEAKRRTLDQVMKNPLALHRAIGQHLGGMSKVAPEAYAQVSARLQAAAQYLHENMPSQLSASLVRPNGIPMSRATARDFALKWNSATNPASVLDDVRDGKASPTQMRTLEAVHPDIYQSLKMQLTRAVAENPESMTTQKKLRMDILFNGDGVAGRAFSWPLAKAIKQMRADRSTGAVGGGIEPTAIGKSTPSRSVSAIKSSVTNA